ncbi:ATP-dependent nuclease [Pacificibacter marinus]|uniref:Recombination protein F n=1 Tax=Pacificibacter marinus TaxID=658057 RepID=A0A1Y5TSS7_9RHOB|nr:AAA family ATPase [Pacificibacter marinus]SEL41777.1 putative ATP-dependent endonuclease of the OLD family [Pacificibacter marinus]SLN71482.1 recombination protein F [Pacificibacter marinus]
MYLSKLIISGFRQFGQEDASAELTFQPGVNALIGKNDSGKTAIIDAVRYALLSRDQMYFKIQSDDFHVDKAGKSVDDIAITCVLSDLDTADQAAFAEHLTYQEGTVSLFVNFQARRLAAEGTARRWVEVNVRSGVEGNGPALEMTVRELLASTYLKPLRDAERELSSGRGSRLSQILYHVEGIKEGADFDPENPPATLAATAALSLLGLSEYFGKSVKTHKGIVDAQGSINTDYLKALRLAGDQMTGKIDLTEGGNEDARLRQILERLELGLVDDSGAQPRGKFGLGSNNILYMACELLLLGREPEGLPLLLVEEPEAHLHPQRQIRLMQFLKRAAEGRMNDGEGRMVQVILSTHSPNLASGLPVANTILLDGKTANPLSEDHTCLSKNDYSFLERFLDATKANLFFAHGVLIVEGDGEALVLPALARAIGFDLNEHGVSIVNVKGTGLRRFSKIFQKSDATKTWISIPVACVADMDVMPDAAPQLLGLVENDDDPKWHNSKRRWKAKRDFGANALAIAAGLKERSEDLCRGDAQNVRTFVSDHWTLEYDLARSGLCSMVFNAAMLANAHDKICEGSKSEGDVLAEAKTKFAELRAECSDDDELTAIHIYEYFTTKKASKAIAAQYLAAAIDTEAGSEGFDAVAFEASLPTYLVDAIKHVCDHKPLENPPTEAQPVAAAAAQ